MLQSIAAWLLRTYLGEYIENLNTDQLSVGYGGIELANLYLKKSALDKLQLPVSLISGVIGQLNLVIPYANPNTQPWIIKIDKLCLIVEADSKIPQKPTEEEIEKLKHQKLEKLEAEWKVNMERNVKGGWWSGSWMPPIYSSISTSIVENLVLEINDVHVRYQYSKKPNLSFGIKVDSLSSKSASKNQDAVTNDIKLKEVELKDFSVYFDRTNVMKDVFQEDFVGLENILGPVRAVAQIQRNISKTALLSKEGPRFQIDVTFEDITLALSQWEYKTFFELIEEFSRYFKALEHHSLRPTVPLKNNSRKWWKFAIQAVMEPIQEKNKKLTRIFLFQRIKDIQNYVKLYMLHLTNISTEATEENKTQLMNIEHRMKVDELIILRKLVFTKIVEDKNTKKKAESQVAAANSNKTWSAWAMSFYWKEQPADASGDLSKTEQIDELTMTKEEREFLDALTETIEQEEASIFKRDSIFAQFCVSLKSGSLILRDNKELKILDVGFDHLNLSFEARPKSKVFEYNVSLGQMLVKNLNAVNQTFPALVSPQVNEQQRDDNEEKAFLTVKFSQRKLQSKSIYSLLINLQPSTIVYQPLVVQKITSFFIVPAKSKYNLKSLGMSEKLQETFHSRFEELKRATQNEFASALVSLNKERGQQDKWNVDLDIAAPNFIVPIQKNDASVSGPDKLVLLNFGRITFVNQHGMKEKETLNAEADEDDDDEFLTPSSTPPNFEDDEQVIDTSLPQDVIIEKFYDSYTLELTKLQVLVCGSKDNLLASQLKGFGPDHTIEQFSVSLSFKRRTLFTADPEFPALLLTGVLPQLFVHIDEKKLGAINSCLEIFSSSDDTTVNMQQQQPAKTTGAVSEHSEVSPQNTQDFLIESKLVLAHFTFEKLSLALHNRGRCFAELQIDGVKCEFSKRPYDMSVSLIISSLRLVDAIQIFGPDYELLVSSKKVAGSCNEVLMHILYRKINGNSPMLGNAEVTPLQVVTVNVNALQLNGNLETLVEINNIINQLLKQTEKPPNKNKPYNNRLSESIDENQFKQEEPNGGRTEISGCFNQIDILILRTELKEFNKIPLHVAHISAKQFEVSALVSTNKIIDGSIGSITVKDVSPKSLFCQNILSIGTAIQTSSPVKMEEQEISKAFVFVYKDSIGDSNTFSVHMASLYYFHNPFFIKELVLCAGDYKQYAYNLAKSLQIAAADMAKSMVLSKSEDLSADTVVIKNEKENRETSYSVCVETPVVIFPKDGSSRSIIVGYLGKITANNESLLEVLDESSTTKTVNRVVVQVHKMNLTLMDITDHPGEVVHESMHEILQLNQNNQIPVIHDTNLLLTIDKCLPSIMLSQRSSSIDIKASINAPLKLFLSVPIYQQFLSTLSFATKLNDDVSSCTTSPAVTPTVSQLSVPTESSWERATVIIEDADVMSIDEDTANQKMSASFSIPSVEIELHGELHGKTHGFVIVRFDGFDLKYNNSMHLYSTVNISLQSFSIEDLLHKKPDKYRYLVSSACDAVYKNVLNRTCSSCPEDKEIFSLHYLSKSLPNIFLDEYKESRSYSGESVDLVDIYESVSEFGPLINVEVIFAKTKSHDVPEAKKSITVDISSIDFVINLQTWVILLEFFGIGAPPTSPSKQEINETLDLTQDEMNNEIADSSSETELQVTMKSVSFYLNKEDYPLAKASIDAMNLHVSMNDSNQDINGSIGNVNLYDLSPYAGYYQQRLISVGDKAIDFSFFRFGKPDPNLERDLDMELTLSMSALQYVHTQRFLMEIISFCQHFLLLQEVLGRMRAASAGDEVMAIVNRAGRLLLKVNADAPILLLPHKATSQDLFVVNLGKLSIENEFVYSSDPKTNGYSFIASRYRTNGVGANDLEENARCNRLLDCIHIKLSDMEIFSALKVDLKSAEGKQKVKYKEQGKKMMSEACLLELTVERNLEWMFGRQVPDISISGMLSSVFVNLDLSQFSLIMGVLGENLGEPLDTFDAPSSVLIDPLVMDSPTKQVWTGMKIKLNLLNVSITISPTFSFGAIKTKTSACEKLARFDFKNSRLIYESFSDGSKSVDLVSSDVLIHDIRDQNQAIDILLPSVKHSTNKDYLQFEVHYLDTVTKSFVTFLCNQSRIILLFDFLLEVWRFISRTEENEFKAANSPINESNTTMEDFETIHSPSVVTKISQVKPVPQPKKKFEMKINITESELVMVEDIHQVDTQTVILKLTAVLAYRPDHFAERPVNCSIQNLEIFSCLLNQPESSALSILDPVAFLIELKSPRVPISSSSIGLQDAMKIKPILEMQFQAPVSIRVSYHDVQMFLHILNTTKQKLATAVARHDTDVPAADLDASLLNSSVSSSKERVAPTPTKTSTETTSSSSIGGLEMKGNVISLVLIDDSGNNDVPLMDLQFSNLLLHHTFDHEWKGLAKCHIDANYYNTRVSAWEPFIEAWKFNIHWFNIIESSSSDKLVIKVDAPERLDMNITCALIGIVQQTANDWSSRFLQDASSKDKKRAPFLPFLLRNKTGCKLTFYTTNRSPTRTVSKLKGHNSEVSSEVLDVRYEVQSNEEVKFAFEKRTKNRHQVSHQLTVHQVVVQVGDWQRMTPLTVDRVEQFFRIAYPANAKKDSAEVFVMFDISLEGARKVITVKSACSITNTLDHPVEVMAELYNKHYNLTVINTKDTYHLPLKMVRAKLYCRPLVDNLQYEYCTSCLDWREVVTSEEKGFIKTCKTVSSSPSIFRFSALITYLGLPKGVEEGGACLLSQPEHSIVLMNHVVLENTLPLDLFYFIKGSQAKELVKPGESIPLFMKDPLLPVEIGFSFENFPTFDLVKILLDGNNHILPARVNDLQGRVLILKVFVTFKCGTVNMSVFSPFWLINKTGIPLVFKREEETEEVSGQFDEHEEARSLTPLLFSFVTSENPFNCVMRIGQNYQRNRDMQPMWSKPFSFDKESDHRLLYVRLANNRLERSYNVGIHISWGKGVFSKTKVVCFVPRYQFDNQTSLKLCVTQRYLLKDVQHLANAAALTTCYPGTVTFYHWYRSDFDQILCVRTPDDTGSLWSGGIMIDCETSFHLNIKSNNKKNPETFLRAHISYNAGTYRCTFSDASLFPPPFRILNLSEVSLFYWQEATGESQMNSFIKGKEVKNYVLDEPTLPAKVTLSVYNQSSETYNLRANSQHGNKLYYENAIYIAFTHTFYGSSCNKHKSKENTNHQFVLDVNNERDVVLARKVQHKRSQLWRMNAEGNLVHFGSSSLNGSRKASFSASPYLVLDVVERKKQSGESSFCLVLNEKNMQRESTQTWFFESNMLRCGLPGLVIYCPDELNENCPVKLGPKPSLNENTSFFCSCISRQKMRPGSGVLSVRVYSQGPTHVLEISDSQQETSLQSWVMLNQTHSNVLMSNLGESESNRSVTEIVLSLAGGLGVSFINLKPEELFFATLSQIKFRSVFNKAFQDIDVEIGSIQIDNQLFGCELPVTVFASPQVKKTGFNTSNLTLEVRMERDVEFNLMVFKDFNISISKLNIELEDRLVLKLIQAIQNLMQHVDDSLPDGEQINIFDSHRIDVKPSENVKDKLFFENFVVNQGELKVSLLATGKIDSELAVTKKSLGVPFISFEDASISFDQYHRSNLLETKIAMVSSVLHFYKETFKSQAAVLLGSLDILGNPMGFIQDFSSGVEGLLKKGNVGGLFVNVAHGFSDSAAKMTGVIADGLWSASMDNKFQESRDSLRVSRASSSSSHFSAGLKGFGMGMIGGLTSMVTQPIEGATKKGVSGFLTGIGKGLVGTVAKPVAGVLDFASGTAAAVRMSTETQSPTPKPVRLKRNCYGPGGVLGKYQKHASEGQEVLLKFNDGDLDEMYVAMEVIRPSSDRLKAILTNKGIYFVKSGPPCPENIKLHIEYTRLLDSQYYFEENSHFIEMFLCRRQDYSIQEHNLDNRTTVRCETERVAFKVTQKVNYFKSLYEESLFAVPKVLST